MKKRFLSAKELFLITIIALVFKVLFKDTPIIADVLGLLYVVAGSLAVVTLIVSFFKKKKEK